MKFTFSVVLMAVLLTGALAYLSEKLKQLREECMADLHTKYDSTIADRDLADLSEKLKKARKKCKADYDTTYDPAIIDRINAGTETREDNRAISKFHICVMGMMYTTLGEELMRDDPIDAYFKKYRKLRNDVKISGKINKY